MAEHLDFKIGDSCNSGEIARRMEEDSLDVSKTDNLPMCQQRGCSRYAFVEDNGRQHQYCCFDHALRHRAESVRSNSISLSKCKLEGCSRPVWIEKDGREHDYCKRFHAKLAAARGLYPPGEKCEMWLCGSRNFDVKILNILEKRLEDKGELPGFIQQTEDVYSCHPWELHDVQLFENERPGLLLFFQEARKKKSKRKRRQTPSGRWRQQGQDTLIKNEHGKVFGKKTGFTYYEKVDVRGEAREKSMASGTQAGIKKDPKENEVKTSWRMFEYSLSDGQEESQWVICHLANQKLTRGRELSPSWGDLSPITDLSDISKP